jgi:gamma-glutamyl-gamma-aminobutyrate hydrolase PuuD
VLAVTFGADHASAQPRYRLNRAYLNALITAGAQPVAVAPGADATPLLDRVDGLVLTGGADVDPAFYGEEPHPLTEAERDRDELELPLVRAAIERGVPVLAICRGHQVVNVALGGTLIQHLDNPEHIGDSAGNRSEIRHPRVRVDPHSVLGELLGVSEIATNSLHHQAVGRLAPGLRATAWADDGVIEGLETPDGILLSVQCHPEELTDTQAWARRLFEAFVGRCGVALPS